MNPDALADLTAFPMRRRRAVEAQIARTGAS